MRVCAYCPEDFNTAEVKECVEKMYKEIYLLQQDKDKLMESAKKYGKSDYGNYLKKVAKGEI